MHILTVITIDGKTKRLKVPFDKGRIPTPEEAREAMLTSARLACLDILNALPLIVYRLAHDADPEKYSTELGLWNIGTQVIHAMQNFDTPLNLNGELKFHSGKSWKFEIGLINDEGVAVHWKTLPRKEE